MNTFMKKSAQPGMKTGDWKNQSRISRLNSMNTYKKRGKIFKL
jgi:hypothetical protein